ncbi:hypothetical protein HNQ57_003290 [Zhongshania antarctica]|uniref:Uncharacterized protein n=1 Tax=Zhongshania antarctica TaxID=641702 RepID=A0A840R9K2_9GAMM|nr:hypothetical protein [Zhongshania antarctica]
MLDHEPVVVTDRQMSYLWGSEKTYSLRERIALIAWNRAALSSYSLNIAAMKCFGCILPVSDQ